ncbi:MAG: metal-dependent transcriptional regulator, partial [Acidobacteria bacterium]|nr:metal-dependent transcriptional regulator [Acidobacteriota bacterium]
EVLEHFISEKLEARIAAYLDNPTHDPHGDPIPALDGTLPESSAQSLANLPEKAQARIVRVSDQDGEHLRYIAKLGLVPGAQVQIIESAPFDGPVSVRVAEAIHAVDRRLARMILVEECS